MGKVTRIFLIALSACSSGEEPTLTHLGDSQASTSKAETHDSIGNLAGTLVRKLVDKLVDIFIIPTHTATPPYADLDNMTFGAPCRIMILPNTNSISPLLLRRHSSLHINLPCTPSDPPSLCAGIQLQRRGGGLLGCIRRVFYVSSHASGNDPDQDELPPVLAMDPRDFRARLVAAERSKLADKSVVGESEESGPGWIHETTVLERGCILLESQVEKLQFVLDMQFLHKGMVLVLSHGYQQGFTEYYTKGIMINRAATREVDGWPVWYGGDANNGGIFRDFQEEMAFEAIPKDLILMEDTLHMTCIHQLESEAIRAMSTCVIKGIYEIPFDQAKKIVMKGDAKKEDFWVFAGYMDWGEGDLQEELSDDQWFMGTANNAFLVGALQKLSENPLSLPRIDSTTGELLPGGDGIELWRQVVAKLDVQHDPSGDLGDRMLREWIRVHLTGVPQPQPRLNSRPIMGTPGEKLSLDTGTLLVSSSVGHYTLRKQYLHKAIMLVLENSDDMIIGALLNRASIASLSFTLPGKGPNAGQIVKKVVSFGGDDVSVTDEELRSMPFQDTQEVEFDSFDEPDLFSMEIPVMPLHHKPELGGVQIGESGVFHADDSFTGEASDLIMVIGLVAWPRALLQRQVKEGAFMIAPNGKIPLERIWALADESAKNSNSLQERIAELRRTEQSGGEIEVWKDQAHRVAKRSCEIWEQVISELGSTVAETKTWEEQLADEALFEWWFQVAKETHEWKRIHAEFMEESDEYDDDEDT